MASSSLSSSAPAVFENDDILDSFPPGFRFVPTDDELVVAYLAKKVSSGFLPPNRIIDVNIYSRTPEELFAMQPNYGDGERYFFTSRDRRYAKGNRPSRSVTGGGTWRATGPQTPVLYRGRKVGYKATLKFDSSCWLMHEYTLVSDEQKPNPRISSSSTKLDGWVLCKIYKKRNSSKQDCSNEDVAHEVHDGIVESQHNEDDQNQIVDQQMPLNQCAFTAKEEERFQGIEIETMDNKAEADQPNETLTPMENHPPQICNDHNLIDMPLADFDLKIAESELEQMSNDIFSDNGAFLPDIGTDMDAALPEDYGILFEFDQFISSIDERLTGECSSGVSMME
ncbi:hypothetical protein ACHQM5_023343 [Ranunculus cassubicifolius]